MQLPKEIQSILKTLSDAGYEAFVVGGCVRDLMLEETPNDWDVTTNATPEEIQQLFPENFYENAFGTVTVKTGSDNESLKEIQITPYRTEAKYTDKRHPDEIEFAKKLNDDLSRRDFTVNALAMDQNGKLIDLFDGQEDLKKKIIRAVGDPEERFAEDALRLLRAVRLATALDFTIEDATLSAIKKHASSLKHVSRERIRDEFTKVISSPRAYEGVLLLEEAGLLQYIIPELREGIGVEQNLHHIYSVWEHNTRALKYTTEKNYSLAVRLASLLHDVGKPDTKRGEGRDCTFYGHEVVGARMTQKIMERLRFPGELAGKITKLVRYHLFYYNVGEVTESSVRRLVANIGKENVEDLLKVREADRIGSGTPKAVPYKLRHLKFMIDKVARDPISPKMLKINGNDLMKLLGIPPGPRVGMIINALMGEVLEDPTKNTKDHLERRAKELSSVTDEELLAIAREGKEKTLEEEEKEISHIKKKHYVQ